MIFPEVEDLADPSDEYGLTTSDKQTIFVDAALSGDYNLLAMGGGIRGTKTFSVLIVLLLLCKLFPGSRWAIVRRDLPTLRRNTIPSIEKIRLMVGGFVGDLKHDTWTYRCANGSEIILFPESYSVDPELDRWKGLEVNGLALEEANELHEQSKNKAIERAGSYTIPDARGRAAKHQPNPIVLCTFNPCLNWPKQMFYDPYMAGTIKKPVFYLPATIFDNPWASGPYKQSLKDNLPDEEYKRFVEGDWTQSDDPDQLIKFEWIVRARSVAPEPGPLVLGWDVARYGPDEAVGTLVRGNALVKIEAMHGVDTNRQGALISTKYINDALDPVDPENVRIDTVGVGGGTYDSLTALGYTTHRSIEGGGAVIERRGPDGKPLSFFKFKNLRAQMHWEFRERLRTGKFSLPDGMPDKLVADLLSVHYSIDRDKVITIESKDKIKETLGRSPDYGDSLIMAAFELPAMPRRPVIAPSFSQFTFST